MPRWTVSLSKRPRKLPKVTHQLPPSPRNTARRLRKLQYDRGYKDAQQGFPPTDSAEAYQEGYEAGKRPDGRWTWGFQDWEA
jgi:hypothetical protein